MMCRSHFVEYREAELIEAKKKDPHFGFLSYWMKSQIGRNMNLNVVFIGAPGTGKSVGCIVVNRKVDEEFTPRTRTCFNGAEFATKISSPEQYGLGPGSAVMYEEGGVGMSSRRSQSGGNMGVNVILQTFRHQNFLTSFNVPDLTFIDKQVRRLTHIIFYAKGVSSKGYSIYEIYFVENNHMGGEPRFIKGLYIKNLDTGRTKCYKTVRFWTSKDKCGAERSAMWKGLIKEYEEEAKKFKLTLAATQRDKLRDNGDSLGANANRNSGFGKSESSPRQKQEVWL